MTQGTRSSDSKRSAPTHAQDCKWATSNVEADPDAVCDVGPYAKSMLHSAFTGEPVQGVTSCVNQMGTP